MSYHTWGLHAPALPVLLPKVEDMDATGDGGVSQGCPSLIGSPKDNSTLTTEVRQLLDDASRWTCAPPSAPQGPDGNSLNLAEQSAHEAIQLEPICSCDGDKRLIHFPSALKGQLEQACRLQNTDLPSCIRTKWTKSHLSSLSRTGGSNKWYDYKTGRELLVAQFQYGTGLQILVARYATGTEPSDELEPFIIAWAGGAWRRWDPEGYVNEPQHIERGVKNQAAKPFNDNEACLVQSDTSDFERNTLVAEKANGTRVRLKCHKCDAQTYTTQQGLFYHLRYSHGIFLKHYEEVVKVCAQPLQSGPHRSTRQRKRKRSSDLPPTSQKTPGTAGGSRQTTSSLCNDSNSPEHNTILCSTTTDDKEINFIFKKSTDDESPRIRPLSACDSVGKLMAHTLVAGIADKDTLMFTVEVNGSRPMYVMRGDTADFDRVIDAIEKMTDKKIAVVVTVENLD